MKIIPEKRLFWFLKEKATLDLLNPSVLDMYIQQVIMYGRAEDIKLLFTRIKLLQVIHLAQDAPYRLEAVKQFPDYPNINVDSLNDIASNKLLALFGRATLRDFDDSAEMLLLLERLDFNDMLIFFNQWREKIARELIK